MRVLITGLCGFIGHHVAEYLLENTDWEIVGLDRVDSTSTIQRLEYIKDWELHRKRVKFLWHDLRSPINPLIAAKLGKVDVVLHLAASTHVDRSLTEPMGFVMDNVVGGCNLLEWARVHSSLKFFINFSTDEVFGPAPEGVAYKEWDRFKSANPYAASKAGMVELTYSYANSFKLPALNTFTMNVVGERQSAEKFVPKVIRAVLNGDKVIIHADPTRTKSGSRFWIHPRNVAAALKFLVEEGVKGNIEAGDRLNIVGEKEVSNLEMAQKIATILDKPLHYELVDFHSSRPGHDLRYAIDGSKLFSMGFSYPWSLEESLEAIVQWYVENPDWLNAP